MLIRNARYLRTPDREATGFRVSGRYNGLMGALNPVNQDIFFSLIDYPRSERDLIKFRYLHDSLLKARLPPSKRAKTIHVDGMDSGLINARDGRRIRK